MHNIIIVWGYSEILHNLCFFSTSFFLVKQFFFSFERNMHGPNLVLFYFIFFHFDFIHCDFEGVWAAREADVETKLKIEAKHSVAILWYF